MLCVNESGQHATHARYRGFLRQMHSICCKNATEFTDLVGIFALVSMRVKFGSREVFEMLLAFECQLGSTKVGC